MNPVTNRILLLATQFQACLIEGENGIFDNFFSDDVEMNLVFEADERLISRETAAGCFYASAMALKIHSTYLRTLSITGLSIQKNNEEELTARAILQGIQANEGAAYEISSAIKFKAVGASAFKIVNFISKISKSTLNLTA